MRRIKKAQITFISLVPKGANKLPVIYKADDSTAEFSALIKESEDFMERGELLAVIYAPEVRDSQGDIASADVIRQMAHDFQKGGGQVDIRHNGKPVSKDDAFVAENFIIQKGDERFTGFKASDGQEVDVTGGWGQIIKIGNEDLRKQYREGKWTGVSMAGPAIVEPDLAKYDRILEALEKSLINQEDEDMKKEEVEALIKESVGNTVAEAIKAALPKKEEPRKEEPKDEGIKFEGDPSNPEDVAKHAEKLAKAELLKGVDFNDPKSVVDYQEKLAELAKKDETEESDEVKALRKEKEELDARLKKAEKASGQPKTDPEGDESWIYTGAMMLTKEEMEDWEVGEEIGDLANKDRGYEVVKN